MSLDRWLAILGLFVGVAGVIVGVWGVRRGRRVKQLDYKIVDNVPLLSARATATRRDLSVSYGGRKLAEPRVVTVRIQNTGDLAVVSHDFTGPLTITFEHDTAMNAVAADSSRENLLIDQDIQFADTPRGYALTPRLLNANEWFSVQIICDGDPGSLSVTATFADQRHPLRDLDHLAERWSHLRWLSGGTLALLGAVLVATSFVFHSSKHPANIPFFTGYGMFILGMTIIPSWKLRTALRRLFAVRD